MDHFFTENSKNEIVWDVSKLPTFTIDKNTHQVMYFARTNRAVSILYYEKYAYNYDYDDCDLLTLEIKNYDYFTTKIPPIAKSNGHHCIKCSCSDVHCKFYQLHNNRYDYNIFICFECYALFRKKCETTQLIKNHETGQTVYYDPNEQDYSDDLYDTIRDAVVNKKYMFERYTHEIDHYHPSYLTNEYSTYVACIRCNTTLVYPDGIPNYKNSKLTKKLTKCSKCIDYSRSIYRDLYLPKFILLFEISSLIKDIHDYVAPIFIDVCNITKFGNTIELLPKISEGGYSNIMEEKEPF